MIVKTKTTENKSAICRINGATLFTYKMLQKTFLNKKTGFGRPVQRLKGIEDGKGNVFAIAELQTKSKVKAGKFGRYEYIAYILADPDKKYETYTTTRSYKGLGETLVKEIVKQAKKKVKAVSNFVLQTKVFGKKAVYSTGCLQKTGVF